MPRGKRAGILIAGGGVAGSLAALAMARLRPDVPVTIVAESDRFGGAATHFLFADGLDAAARDLMRDAGAHAWRGFYLAFPGLARKLKADLLGLAPDALHEAMVATLDPQQYGLGTKVVAVRDDALVLDGGEELRAEGTIDARGAAWARSARPVRRDRRERRQPRLDAGLPARGGPARRRRGRLVRADPARCRRGRPARCLPGAARLARRRGGIGTRRRAAAAARRRFRRLLADRRRARGEARPARRLLRPVRRALRRRRARQRSVARRAARLFGAHPARRLRGACAPALAPPRGPARAQRRLRRRLARGAWRDARADRRPRSRPALADRRRVQRALRG